MRTQTHIDAQRRLGFSFVYRLSPVNPGSYTIPAISISTPQGALRTEAIPFTVHSPDKLINFPTGVQNQNLKAAWFPDKTSLYQGEQCRVFLKLYIPTTLNIAGWGYPDATKVNCLAWRFSPPPEHGYSEVSLDNVIHKVVTYSTTLSGLQPGVAALGPSKLTLHHRTVQLDPTRGLYITRDLPINLTLPTLDFEIKALPTDAPSDFHGAVGNFEIDAYTEKHTFTEVESTELILRIAGRGNLPTIKAPVLQGTDWKIIDTAKITRGEERRFINGIVTFRQIIKLKETSNPTTPNSPSHIPAYSFSYFDPEKKIYQTKTTPPIPVTILPSRAPTTTASEELGTRPDEMRSILGFIDRPSTTNSKHSIYNSKLWHILPASICLLIFLPLIRRKIAASRVQHPDTERKNAALAKVSENSDTRTFYRRAGRFIEQWLTINPELAQVIQERDTICFTPEHQEIAEVPKERRTEIINILKRCSKLTLILLLTLITLPEVTAQHTQNPAPGSNAEDAWKSGKYQEAINLYRTTYPEPSNTPADVLFNIGNCHHRLDQPGPAALAYRQALAVAPTHKQARQNLRFVEIENNALVPEYQPWQLYLVHFPQHIYQTLSYTTLWIIGIIVLILIVRRPRGLALGGCITFLVLSPTLATIAIVASHHYPDDHRFAPTEAQAIILDEAPLY